MGRVLSVLLLVVLNRSGGHVGRTRRGTVGLVDAGLRASREHRRDTDSGTDASRRLAAPAAIAPPSAPAAPLAAPAPAFAPAPRSRLCAGSCLAATGRRRILDRRAGGIVGPAAGLAATAACRCGLRLLTPDVDDVELGVDEDGPELPASLDGPP